jgi:lambda family phage portal protein|tara:strand:- start:2494 stop:3972 length:1479 start_codon:yes stop_codon:yes gene_type:complete
MGIKDIFRRTPAPEKPAKRGRRSYSGANQGRLFADFPGSSFSADSELYNTLPLLRNRCRDLARNNEYAKRFLTLMKTNVVGDRGFNLQVRARNSNGSIDISGNDIIETAWKQWGRLGRAEIAGRLSWVDCQRLAVETLARDGEVFIKMVRGAKYHNNFTLQFIESDLVDNDKNGLADNGNQIRMGVEVDKDQKPTAYYVLTAHPGDGLNSNYGTVRKHIRVPADDILHIYMPSRPFQTRGEPFMAPAIASLKMLHGYREAELIAARSAAAKFGVITTPAGDEFTGDDEVDEVPVIDWTPGSMYQLPAGHDLKLIDATHPVTAFADFEAAVLRGIAAGLNVSYTSLSQNLEGVSYSSIRQGTIEDRDYYRMLQAFLIDHLCVPVYTKWLETLLSFTDFAIPSSKFYKFSENSMWRGRGYAWVDPLKEINASVTALSNGLISLSDVAAHYGKDVEELFSSLQADKELAAQYGLAFAHEPFGDKTAVDPFIAGEE